MDIQCIYVGYPGQTLPETIKILPKTLKNQEPKIIILESNNFYDALNIVSPVAKVVNVTLPVIEFHNRWKNLNKEDFFSKVEYTNTNVEKGYHYIDAVIPADDSNYMIYSDDIAPIPKANQIYIELIKKYCDSKGIKFMIVSVPSCINWNYAKHNAVKQFAEKENIDFLDLNELKDEIKIDWQTETGDGGDHVNYKGALKATKYLGQWLSKKNILENHKNDEKYKKWNEDLEKIKEKYKI